MPTPIEPEMPKKRTSLVKLFGRVLLFVYLIPVTVLALLHYPYDTDQASDATPKVEKQESYYEAAYEPPSADADEYASRYARIAAEVADEQGVEEMLHAFVETYELHDKRVLEVGSGTGRWQDLVDDYTGLDISPSVAAQYHKPFVQASATDMPFPDNSFDAIWTIWVLEHIPSPERALAEMRRVLKDDGMLCLVVAWNCAPWLADGYPVRPYSDFGRWGKLVKSSVAMRSNPWFVTAYRLPVRLARLAGYKLNGAGTRLHYRTLEPNFDQYWMADSDAAVSLDQFETYLWFRSRGDTCVTSAPPDEEIHQNRNPLIVKVRKRAALSAARN